jgi:hypothetical protein
MYMYIKIEVWDWGCEDQGQLGKKLSRLASTNKLAMMVCTCNLSYAGSLGRRIEVQDGFGKNGRLSEI